jgi:hypothetical protein
MATKVYETGQISLMDDRVLNITPLKIKYLRQFMDRFEDMKDSKNEEESMSILIQCAAITMQQYCPEIKTQDDVEDSLDMSALYDLLDFSAGIKLKPSQQDLEEVPVKKRAEDNPPSWDALNLAELESEVFLLGIWKDYEELELSLSLPELMSTLNAKRDADYQEKKFLAAIQGVDLDEQSGKKEEDPWEAMKARVFSGGATSDPNDITSLQGTAAVKAGFGIGNGLSYEKW